MDSCMTCVSRNRCDLFLHEGNIVGCPTWKPVDKLGIRRSLDAGRPILVTEEPKDELSAASGIVLGLVISIPLWILAYWTWKVIILWLNQNF